MMVFPNELKNKLYRIIEDKDFKEAPKKQPKVDEGGGMETTNQKAADGAHKKYDQPTKFTKIKPEQEFNNEDPTREDSDLDKLE